MSELDRALEWWENNQEVELDRRELRRLCGVFADAARRFASLTSPETIEKAAKAIFDYTFEGEQSWDDHQSDSPYLEEFRSEARAALAVLRSVEEGTEQ